MRSLIVCLSVVVGLSGMFAATAMADDLNPPPWRGQPGTTWGAWEFYTADPITTPDAGYNPYGQSSAQAWPGVGQAWAPTWGGADGVWPLSGTIEVTIPNRPEPLPYKEIWVQLTWAKQVSGSCPFVKEKNSGITGSVINEVVLGPTGEPGAGDVWYHTTFLVHLEPNPDWEIVKIDGTVMVDELVIDTICAPEPAGLILLALGSLAVLRSRRR